MGGKGRGRGREEGKEGRGEGKEGREEGKEAASFCQGLSTHILGN